MSEPGKTLSVAALFALRDQSQLCAEIRSTRSLKSDTVWQSLAKPCVEISRSEAQDTRAPFLFEANLALPQRFCRQLPVLCLGAVMTVGH